MTIATGVTSEPDLVCDAIVVGGGPAGSTAASVLARAGRRVILLERDRFPRFHVGESLLASVNDVLREIGADTLVRAAGFPQKWGATFMSADGRIERYADFSIAPDVPAPQTWQVPRATFDDLLLRHAAAQGADVREGHRVVEVGIDDGGVTVSVQRSSVQCAEEEGRDGQPGANAGRGSNRGRETEDQRPKTEDQRREPKDEDPASSRYIIRAHAIIDASGRGSLVSRQFGLRMDEPRLANIAVFSHYSGVPRRDGRRSGDIRVVARGDLGWFWLIPISDELMSVGVVLPRDAARSFVSLGHEAWLDRAIAETPAVAGLLAGATREWPVRVERDFSFGSKAYAGPRWFLAGDAGSFLDPVFSTGVAIALESGLEAGQAVARSLETGDWSGRHGRRFSRRQRQRYESFRRFVLAFYTPEFRDLFFDRDPPKRMFRSMVAIFAGYWRPPATTRFWVAMFFLLVRLQRRFGIVPRH